MAHIKQNKAKQVFYTLGTVATFVIYCNVLRPPIFTLLNLFLRLSLVVSLILYICRGQIKKT